MGSCEADSISDPAPDVRLFTGMGFDAHRFASDNDARPLWIACLHWEGTGLIADSDGDVAAHALIDSLLSAAQLGDIGGYFGVGGQSRAAGMSGRDMLIGTVEYLHEMGYRPHNASVSIIATRPRINRRRKESEEVLSLLLSCPVSVSASTTDGMGFTGEGQGVAAMASALVSKIS